MSAAPDLRSSGDIGIWLMQAPDIGTYLPGGAFTIDVDPPPRRPIGLRNIRAVHGLITNLSRLGHHPTTPVFSLIPWNAGIGWASYVSVDSVACAMARRTHHAHLFGRPCNVRLGPLARLRAPIVGAPGPRILRIRTQTPIVIRGLTDPGCRPGHRRIGPALTSTMTSWLPRRVGLELGPQSVRTEVICASGGMRRVQLGGHLGAVYGWTGEIILRTNACGHWLLELGARIGFGGRVAFGFGRITVERGP